MTVRLSECCRGDRLKIVEIDAGRGAVLNLMDLGLAVGRYVELRRRSLFRGPILVAHGEGEVAIGHRLAEKILVEKE